MARKRHTRTVGLGDHKGYTPRPTRVTMYAPLRPHAQAEGLCEEFGKAKAGHGSSKRRPDKTRVYPAPPPWGHSLNRMNREEARDCAIALAIKVDLGTDYPRRPPVEPRSKTGMFHVKRSGGKRLNAKQLARVRLTDAELEARLQRLEAPRERMTLDKALKR